MKKNLDAMVACPACDWLVRKRSLPRYRHAHCPRCQQRLYGDDSMGSTQLVALSVTGLLLAPTAFFQPLITIRLLGDERQATVLTGIQTLFESDHYFVAGLLLWSAILAPVGIFSLIFLLASGVASRCHVEPWLLKILHRCEQWAMLEVYAVSLLVVLFKLVSLAEVTLGWGLISVGGMMLLSLVILTLFDTTAYWEAVHERR